MTFLSFTVLFLSPAGSHFCFDYRLPFYLQPEALIEDKTLSNVGAVRRKHKIEKEALLIS